jgi:4-hydroxy-tetrahydrodipicolinate reductase
VPADTRRSPLCRAVLVGVSGRMGQALLCAAPGFPQLIITGAVASAASLALGRDTGELTGSGRANLRVTSDLPAALAQADVAVDFSSAEATAATLAACRAARKPLLIGTTGFPGALESQLDAAAGDIPLLVAANTSLGAALLAALTRIAAKSLPQSFDIDILDLHHRLKRDAPSGTALALGRAAAEARGTAPPTAADALARHPGPRPEGQIGFAVVRAGDLVGEHTVLFSGHGEALALTHRASDRAIFARGALAAALWLVSRPPGRYDMEDFLGLKTVT